MKIIEHTWRGKNYLLKRICSFATSCTLFLCSWKHPCSFAWCSGLNSKFSTTMITYLFEECKQTKTNTDRRELTSSDADFSGVIFAAERRKPRAHHSIRSHKRKNLAFFMSMVQYWRPTWLWLEALVVAPCLLEQLLEMGLAVWHSFERGIVAQLSKAKKMNTEIVRPCITAHLCLPTDSSAQPKQTIKEQFSFPTIFRPILFYQVSKWEADKIMISWA